MFNKHFISFDKQKRNELPQRGDEIFTMHNSYYYTVAVQEILIVN